MRGGKENVCVHVLHHGVYACVKRACRGTSVHVHSPVFRCVLRACRGNLSMMFRHVYVCVHICDVYVAICVYICVFCMYMYISTLTTQQVIWP